MIIYFMTELMIEIKNISFDYLFQIYSDFLWYLLKSWTGLYLLEHHLHWQAGIFKSKAFLLILEFDKYLSKKLIIIRF